MPGNSNTGKNSPAVVHQVAGGRLRRGSGEHQSEKGQLNRSQAALAIHDLKTRIRRSRMCRKALRLSR